MWAVVDLETTIHSAFKRKANPFLLNEDGTYKNWVVMMGWCTRDDPAPAGCRMTPSTQHLMTERFVSLLQNNKLIVGQNIKFDITYMIRDPHAYQAWMTFVADGGLVWDLQLAEYLMQGQVRTSHMMSLDDLALLYNEDLKVDEVKKLWQAGVHTEDIDPDLLSRYLLGEKLYDPATGDMTGVKEGDIGVTRNIFLKQIVKAQSLKMMKNIQLNMGSLLATIEMERNGMFVNKERGFELAQELKDELDGATAELNHFLPKDLPFEFNWGNRYHLSPLIFGGKVKYARRSYELADGSRTWEAPPEEGHEHWAYAQKDEVHYVLEDGTTCPCGYYGFSGYEDKRVRYKGGKNAGEFKTKKVKVNDWTKPKSRMDEDHVWFDGFTKPRGEWASSTEGLYSVAADVIDALTAATTIPFLKTLGKVAKLSKDLGTYFISTDEKTGESKGMLTLVGDDNIVHHGLNHTSTVTARFSSSNPNLQNIPKGNKSKAKEMFQSRWGVDGSIIQSDFSSLEVYVQANLTKSENLIIELLKGTDLHCLRLSKKEHKDYDEVLKLCKGYKHIGPDGVETFIDAVPEWDYKRTGAKVFSFQLAYGAGAQTIADATGLPLEEVQQLIDAERELFPEIDAYFEKRGQDIERAAKPTQQFVMHPENPAVRVQILVSRIQMATGKMYTYMSQPSPRFMLKRGVTSTFSPTERKNYEVQGEGGEIMKCAMWLAVREFYKFSNFGGLALLVNTVHDALYADCHHSVQPKVLAVVHACMESATDFYCHHFGVKWSVPVPSDTSYGSSMAEENKAKLDPAMLEEAKAAINQRYLTGFVKPYHTLEK